MKTTKIRIIAIVLFVALVAAWGVLFNAFKSNFLELFPQCAYETYALIDANSGGFSTSEISVQNDAIVAKVNVRSGMAYPYAGVGFNMMSLGNRPAPSRFDFSKFDTISVVASAGRMRSLMLRIMTDDVDFTQNGNYLSYRPLLASIPVASSNAEVKVALSAFKVQEQWLVAHGLDHDDGHTYWDRTLLFEISNGEGALRGIPDEFEIRSIRFSGENRSFMNAMYVALAFIIVAFVAALVVPGRKETKIGKKPLKRRGENA